MNKRFLNISKELTIKFIEITIENFEKNLNEKELLQDIMSILLTAHFNSLIIMMNNFSKTKESKKITNNFVNELEEFIKKNHFITPTQTFQVDTTEH